LVDTHSRRLKKKIITPNEDDRDLFTEIATGNILQVKSLLHKGVNPNCSLEGWIWSRANFDGLKLYSC
jgi:hypothetical protein